MIKNIYSIQWIQGKLCFQGKRKLLKILNDKNISIQWKISGPLVFFWASASCSKILSDKIYFQCSEFRANPVFRGSAICSTILNVKKFIFNTVNLMQVLLSGLAQVAQKSWMIEIFQYSETFQSNSCFSGLAQVAQNSWMIKNVYSMQWIQGKLCFQGKRKLLKNPEC